MTEGELIATLKKLMDDAHASYRVGISSKGYHEYLAAMAAVIERYRHDTVQCKRPATGDAT